MLGDVDQMDPAPQFGVEAVLEVTIVVHAELAAPRFDQRQPRETDGNAPRILGKHQAFNARRMPFDRSSQEVSEARSWVGPSRPAVEGAEGARHQEFGDRKATILGLTDQILSEPKLKMVSPRNPVAIRLGRVGS